MAWEISTSAEDWAEIREKLEDWSSDQLIDAMCDDKFETVIDRAGLEHATLAATAERKRIADLPHDLLVDRAFELVEQNNTSDNGGWACWVDRQGYHKVQIGD